MHDGAVLHGTVEMAGSRNDSPWMSVEELSRYLEVESATVVDWASSGRLPGQRDNGQWRFERVKIQDWLAKERIK